MNTHKRQNGFTLMEMMVSTTIFLIVIMLGIMSLIATNHSQKVTQYKKQQFDIINAVMEDMVRHVRTSTRVRCDINGDYSTEVPKDCYPTWTDDAQPSFSVGFEHQDGVPGDINDQYRYEIANLDGSGFAVYKSTGGPHGELIRLTPYPISINPENSGFSVLYAEDEADGQQPLVSIRLSGNIRYQSDSIPFNFQTSVTPRALEFSEISTLGNKTKNDIILTEEEKLIAEKKLAEEKALLENGKKE